MFIPNCALPFAGGTRIHQPARATGAAGAHGTRQGPKDSPGGEEPGGAGRKAAQRSGDASRATSASRAKKPPTAPRKEAPRGRGPRGEAGRGGGPNRPRSTNPNGRGRGPADEGGHADNRTSAAHRRRGATPGSGSATLRRRAERKPRRPTQRRPQPSSGAGGEAARRAERTRQRHRATQRRSAASARQRKGRARRAAELVSLPWRAVFSRRVDRFPVRHI